MTLREKIARFLFERRERREPRAHFQPGHVRWEGLPPRLQGDYYDDADAILAIPEIADALAIYFDPGLSDSCRKGWK